MQLLKKSTQWLRHMVLISRADHALEQRSDPTEWMAGLFPSTPKVPLSRSQLTWSQSIWIMMVGASRLLAHGLTCNNSIAQSAHTAGFSTWVTAETKVMSPEPSSGKA